MHQFSEKVKSESVKHTGLHALEEHGEEVGDLPFLELAQHPCTVKVQNKTKKFIRYLKPNQKSFMCINACETFKSLLSKFKLVNVNEHMHRLILLN